MNTAGESPSAESSAGSTRTRALKASLWVMIGKPLGMGMQLLRSLVLTRLLSNFDFGVMTMITVVLQGLQMCSDVGVTPNVVRHERGLEERFLQTAWTVSIIRGAILWLACCALA